jgi:hypothetical protein
MLAPPNLSCPTLAGTSLLQSSLCPSLPCPSQPHDHSAPSSVTATVRFPPHFTMCTLDCPNASTRPIRTGACLSAMSPTPRCLCAPKPQPHTAPHVISTRCAHPRQPARGHGPRQTALRAPLAPARLLLGCAPSDLEPRSPGPRDPTRRHNAGVHTASGGIDDDGGAEAPRPNLHRHGSVALLPRPRWP